MNGSETVETTQAGARWLRPSETCLAVVPGQSGVLIDAKCYYRALADAIESAKRHVVISAWQIDSQVQLRRGSNDDRGLLRLLRDACHRNPELEVYILAWDFSVFYAFEREWWMPLRFDKRGGGRIRLLKESPRAWTASQHAKYVIVDGQLAFVGGIDVCDHRWDDSRHVARNPERLDRGGHVYGPYHDVQAVVSGEAAHRIGRLFAARWKNAGGGELDLPPVESSRELPAEALTLECTEVGISRTRGGAEGELRVREVRRLYLDAIDRAERLIYLENQYFTSRAVVDAFERRLTATNRSKLQIVFVVPMKAEKPLEEIVLGNNQLRYLKRLDGVARQHGHSFRVYCTGDFRDTSHEDADASLTCATYIHSKLLIVDDRLLTIGSANATNRSLGLDNELNLAWEAVDERESESIRAVRLALLSEHTSLRYDEVSARLSSADGLVEHLDACASARGHKGVVPYDLEACSEPVTPIDNVIQGVGDPDGPLEDEDVFEQVLRMQGGSLARMARTVGRFVKTVQARMPWHDEPS